MAKSASIKWCIAVVALLAFIAYDRHRRTIQPTAATVNQRSLAGAERTSGKYHYAAIPALQPIERLKNANVSTTPCELSTASGDAEIPLLSLQGSEDSHGLELEEIIDNHKCQLEAPINDEPLVIGDHHQQELPQSADWGDDHQERVPELNNEFVSVLSGAAGTRIVGFSADKVDSDEDEVVVNDADEIESASVAASTPTVRQPIPAVSLSRGVLFKVVDHIEYGKSLARRGATFGAQQEFLAALRLVAQTIDHQLGSRESTDRLFVALLALKESDDFYHAQAENNGRVDVATIAIHHQSKILNRQQLSTISPMEAMQAYYDFVQEKLVACSGHTVVAGEALYCLGKLYNMNANNATGGTRLDNAKAIVFHGAALQCDSRNYKSANELGVLYSKAGRFDLAKGLLLQSLRIRPLPKVWENLAFVHQQLGETELARRAQVEYQQLLDAPAATQTARIQWVSAEEFAEQSIQPIELRTAKHQDLGDEKQTTTTVEPSSFKKALNRWF